jgi:putative transposase
MDLQQFRECVSGDEGYRFIIHERDRIYSQELDESLKSLGLTVVEARTSRPKRIHARNASSEVFAENA